MYVDSAYKMLQFWSKFFLNFGANMHLLSHHCPLLEHAFIIGRSLALDLLGVYQRTFSTFLKKTFFQGYQF